MGGIYMTRVHTRDVYAITNLVYIYTSWRTFIFIYDEDDFSDSSREMLSNDFFSLCVSRESISWIEYCLYGYNEILFKNKAMLREIVGEKKMVFL